MMGEGWEKHIIQEGCAEKAGMVKSVAMGAVCRSLAMVPEGWGRLSLGEFTCPKQWPTISKAEFTQEGFPVFGANGIIGRYSRYNHEKPAIVVTCRGATCGEVSMTPPMSYITGNAMAIDNIDSSKADPFFLFYVLKHRGLFDIVSGSAQPQIIGKDIKAVRVNLPPLPEQRKIAQVLSTWDRAIELTEALLAAARTRKRGLMQILLTGKRRFSEFEGQEWREVRLGEVASVDRHSLGSKTAPDFTFDYISLSNVEPGRIVGPLKQVIFEKAPSRARRILELGDLLISTVRPNLLGFARVTEEYQNCIASTGFAVVTPKPEADASYLFHYLFSHHIKSQFHSLVVGSNYPAINSSDVLKLKVRLPSVDEQHKIGAVLNGCDEEITALIGKIEILHTQKKALMQKLLTGEWRVKVEDPVV